MLMPALMSCRGVKTKKDVVKEDDPWFETTRFKLEKDIRKYETVGDSEVCTSNDRLFSIYPLTKDMWGSCRTVLDTYDFAGNLLERKELSCPDGFRVQSIYSAGSQHERDKIPLSQLKKRIQICVSPSMVHRYITYPQKGKDHESQKLNGNI